MKRLNRHLLDFDIAKEYFRNNLEKTNALSDQLLILLDFSKGSFFTLLPDDADISKINKFEEGGILPQNPLQEYDRSKGKSSFSIIPLIDDELSYLIVKNVESNIGLSCVFDDVLRSLKDIKHEEAFYKYGFFFNDEIYYLLNKENINYENTKECLKLSNSSFWHSLCVIFSQKSINFEDKIFNPNTIRNICINTELIILSAYDREGYIFWGKEGFILS